MSNLGVRQMVEGARTYRLERGGSWQSQGEGVELGGETEEMGRVDSQKASRSNSVEGRMLICGRRWEILQRRACRRCPSEFILERAKARPRARKGVGQRGSQRIDG